MARQNTDIIYSQKLKEKMHSNVIFLRLSWWSWILTIFGALSLAGGRKLWVWNGLVIMPRWQWPPAPGTCSKQSPHYSSQVIRLEERPARPPPWLCLSRKRPRNLCVVFMPLVKLKHTQAGRGWETKHLRVSIRYCQGCRSFVLDQSASTQFDCEEKFKICLVPANLAALAPVDQPSQQTRKVHICICPKKFWHSSTLNLQPDFKTFHCESLQLLASGWQI